MKYKTSNFLFFTNAAKVCWSSRQKGIPRINLLQCSVIVEVITRRIIIVLLKFSGVYAHSHNQEKPPRNNIFVQCYKTHQKWYGYGQSKEMPPPKSQCNFSAFPDDVFLKCRRCVLIFFQIFIVPQTGLIKT